MSGRCRALARTCLVLILLGAGGAHLPAADVASAAAPAASQVTTRLPAAAPTPGATAGDLITSAAGAATVDRAQGPLSSLSAGPVTVTIAHGPAGSGLSSVLSLFIGISLLAFAPAALLMVTSFTRILIVLGFLRRALGTQTLPPNQIMVGLSLFLTLFIMAPTFHRLNRDALQPYMANAISQDTALDRAGAAMRDFLGKQTRKNDLALFIHLAGEARPASLAEVSFTTLVPAFMTSELKTAFQMGFIISLPFLIIDLVVSAVLMALGMMMLPPPVISLPFKILLFVLVDGWTLLMQSLVASYG